MQKKITLVFLIFILINIGCKNDIVDPKPLLPETNYEPLIPLKVGNYWLYMNYKLNPDGTGDIPEQYKFGYIIDDTLQLNINGKIITCYKVFNCGEELKPYYDKPGSFEGSKLVYNTNEGLYYTGIEKYNKILIQFNDLIFSYQATKYSIVDGHMFYYSTIGNYHNVSEGVITKYTCISKDSLLSTPIGDFRCIVYRMAFYDLENISRLDVNYFIKPCIGIVGMYHMKYDYNSKQYSYVRKTLLKDYKIVGEKNYEKNN